MAARLEGKRALITGAGQGIGRGVALAFAEEGATVIATSRTWAKLVDLPGIASNVTTMPLDVTDTKAVERTFAESGPIDVLVNCAGWVHHGTILDCGEEDWANSLDQNVTACYRTMRAALPTMLRRGKGTIVNVASVASSITGVANRAA